MQCVLIINCVLHVVISEDRTSWNCVVCNKNSGDAASFNIIRHFLSEKHRKNVAAKSSAGSAVREGVASENQERLYRDNIATALIDDAIVTSARKSLPFTAVPLMLDHTARGLTAVAGEQLANVPINEVRKVSKDAADILLRLRAVVKRESTSSGPRIACRRGRAYLRKRLSQLATQSSVLKVQFLRRCQFLCVSIDETDAWSLTSPLAVALQGCDPEFNWGNFYIGQTDVSLAKDGEGCFKATKRVIQSADDAAGEIPDGMISLWDAIVWSTTDGASAMRSTPMYAGLDSRPRGASFVAHMKRDGKPNIGNIHCICHNFNLALKDAMAANPWSTLWMDHIRAVYNWFAKSPARKTKFASLSEEMSLLDNVVTWKMVYPKYYCPTRWVGICTALASIVGASDLHVAYCKHLMDEDFVPCRDTTDELPAEAMDAREEEGDGEDIGRRAHEDSFYKFKEGSPQPWDLDIKSIDGDIDVKSAEDRVALDQGEMSTRFRAMKSGRRHKKSKLLNELIGMTDLNLGLDCMILDALQPYKQLVERLQVQNGPVGHRVCGWIIEFFDTINTIFLDDYPTFGHHFNLWEQKHKAPEHDGLVQQVKAMGRSFLHALLQRVKYRIQPYWKLIMGLELINPCSPLRVARESWEGIDDLMRRAGFNEAKRRQACNGLKMQRLKAKRWTLVEILECNRNLLRFYKDQLLQDKAGITQLLQLKTKYPVVFELAQLVFSLHMASAIIETFFSKTSYIKSKNRKSMSDDTVSDVLHVSQTPYPADVEKLLPNAISIDVTVASLRKETDIDELREKYVDRKVRREFTIDNNIVQCSGVVSKVYWCTDLHKFLYLVTYEDGDKEELELWQLRTFIT